MSSVQVSESALASKMLVSVKAEKDPITEGGFPVIIGTVSDQAYKPIANANVLIMFGTVIVTTTSDDQGNFRYESAMPSTHGIYEVDVTATKDGYAKGLGSSTFTVSPRQTTPVVTKTITGLPIQAGNYTVFLGKVVQWNLETTCFVDFSDKYMRFLKTCDLYNMAPEDFKDDQAVIPMVSVIQSNDTYRLYPENVYINAANMENETLNTFVASTFANYTAP
ncbi:MAG: carboxypeptidase-like regulatory domain-containing protein [Nitrosotalea sp.]